jgi:thiol:disulfide interchange protein DsbD
MAIDSSISFVEKKTPVTGDINYDRLLSNYSIRGVPTIVFLDALGKERKDLRLVDFVQPNEFLNRMVSLR